MTRKDWIGEDEVHGRGISLPTILPVELTAFTSFPELLVPGQRKIKRSQREKSHLSQLWSHFTEGVKFVVHELCTCNGFASPCRAL